MISKYINRSIKGNKKSKALYLLSLIVLTVLSFMYLRYTWIINMNATAEQALKAVKIAEASLNEEVLKELNAEQKDFGTTAYESIKDRLMYLVRIEEGARFAYIYKQINGKLYFIADSEPVDSEDYSPPGQEYIKANSEDKKPFETGKCLITKPVTDYWGNWVRVLVPMKDNRTGETVAVLGIDYPAKSWNDAAQYCTVQAGVIIFSLFLLLTVFYIMLNISYKNFTLTKVNQMMEQVEENVNGFFNTINDMIFVLDMEANIIHLNHTACRKLEYLEDEIIGKPVNIINAENKKEEVQEVFFNVLSGKEVDCHIPVITKSGLEIPVETHTVMGKWDGKTVLFVIIKDITELKKSEEKFSKAFQSNPALMTISTVDDGQYIDVNDAFLKTLKFNRHDVIGSRTLDLDIFVEKEKIEIINKEFEKNKKVSNVEIMLKEKNGFVHNGICSVDSIALGGKPCCLTTVIDITERKKAEDQILYLSYHDQLTGLHNRRFYEEELKRLNVKRNLPLTIVMGDVNGLKLINDSFGHAIGDKLLKKSAQVITQVCRKKDIVARIGGDEFIMLLPKTDSLEAEKIIKQIKLLLLKEKVGHINISISFGFETKKNVDESIQDVFKKAEDYMYKKKFFQSPSTRGDTINAIISTLHEKNKREEQHSQRVSELSEIMGKALGLSEYEINKLKTVGLLHDIGKIAIEENILNKPGKLTNNERREVEKHPEIGYRILSTVNDMHTLADYVLAHHERWDGRGYPRGLKEKEIPFQARIIAIVDTYDAMTSERSYRSALPEEVALAELEKNAGIQFDPELVKVFIEKVLRESETNK